MNAMQFLTRTENTFIRHVTIVSTIMVITKGKQCQVPNKRDFDAG